jgi:protein kinase C substrate 80K-H
LVDVAELVYSTSGLFHSPTTTTPEVKGSHNNQIAEEVASSTCSLSHGNMCPPRTVMVEDGKMYPPSFIVDAAQKRCELRENTNFMAVCTNSDEEDNIEFPTTVTDGYLNYHPPQSRTPDDEFVPAFSALDTLYYPPSNVLELIQRTEELGSKTKSLSKRVADLERDIGDDDSGVSTKYGIEGELYAFKDTCHKLEYGKYEYEVCITGKATQREIGQGGSGGTHLGSWKAGAAYIDEDGQRTFKWEGGTRCWNGPDRSAEVTVTCGADTRLLTADEPETCRYAFTMESPIGCDGGGRGI